MRKSVEELYKELMVLAYQMEDQLSYNETQKGKEWGELVNKLQEFEPPKD